MPWQLKFGLPILAVRMVLQNGLQLGFTVEKLGSIVVRLQRSVSFPSAGPTLRATDQVFSAQWLALCQAKQAKPSAAAVCAAVAVRICESPPAFARDRQGPEAKSATVTRVRQKQTSAISARNPSKVLQKAGTQNLAETTVSRNTQTKTQKKTATFTFFCDQSQIWWPP